MVAKVASLYQYQTCKSHPGHAAMVPSVGIRHNRASYTTSAQAPPGVANCPLYISVSLNNGMIATLEHGMTFDRSIFLTHRSKISLSMMMVVIKWDWVVLRVFYSRNTTRHKRSLHSKPPTDFAIYQKRHRTKLIQ